MSYSDSYVYWNVGFEIGVSMVTSNLKSILGISYN